MKVQESQEIQVENTKNTKIKKEDCQVLILSEIKGEIDLHEENVLRFCFLENQGGSEMSRAVLRLGKKTTGQLPENCSYPLNQG